VAATAAVSPTAKLRAAATRAPVLQLRALPCCSCAHPRCVRPIAAAGCNLGVQLPSASQRWRVPCARGWTARADRLGPRTAAGACLTAMPTCARTCSRGKATRAQVAQREALLVAFRWILRCARPSRACSSQAMAGTHPRGRLLPHAGREDSLRKRRCRLRCLAPGGSSVWGIVSMRHRTLRAIH